MLTLNFIKTDDYPVIERPPLDHPLADRLRSAGRIVFILACGVFVLVAMFAVRLGVFALGHSSLPMFQALLGLFQ